MPFRSASITSSPVRGRLSSISRFFRLARMVPSTSVRGLSWALRAAVSAARKVSPRSGAGDTRATAILADRGVHLPLPLLARLLEVAVLAEVRQDSGLLALLLEPLERPLEALVIVDDDFRHSLIHPSRARLRAGIGISWEIYGRRRMGARRKVDEERSWSDCLRYWGRGNGWRTGPGR